MSQSIDSKSCKGDLENVDCWSSDSDSSYTSTWEEAYDGLGSTLSAPMKLDISAFPKDSLHYAVAVGDVATVRSFLHKEYEGLHARYKIEVQRFKTRTVQLFATKDLPSEAAEMQRLKRKLQFGIEKKWRELLARRDLCGRSLLHLAAASSCFTVLRVLYESNGVKPTSTCFYRGKRRELYRDDAVYDFQSGDEVSRYSGNSVTLKSLRNSRRALLQFTDDDGYTPMDYAIAGSQRSAMKYFARHNLEKRPGLNSGLKRLIRDGLFNGSTSNLVNADNSNGWTAMHHAVFERGSSRDQMKRVQALLEQDIEVNAKTNRGRTALHLAAVSEYSNTAVLKYLVINGADIDAVDNDGNTPLMLAASRNRYDTVEMLAQKGADLFTCNKQGYNALHLAARIGHATCVRLLVRLDSDLRKLKLERTPNGSTAEELSGLPRELFRSTWEAAETGDLKQLHRELDDIDINVATMRSFQTKLTLLHSVILGCGRQMSTTGALEATLRFLLRQWPAMVLVRDRHDRSPIDLARRIRAPQWVLDMLNSCADRLDVGIGAEDNDEDEEKGYASTEEDELQVIADKHFRARNLRKHLHA